MPLTPSRQSPAAKSLKHSHLLFLCAGALIAPPSLKAAENGAPSPNSLDPWDCTVSITPAGQIQRCIGKLESYPLPVAVISSVNFNPALPHKTILYLHGHNTRHESLIQLIKDPDTSLEVSIASLPAQSVVIMPQSLNRCDELKLHLSTYKQLENLLNSVRDQFKISTSTLFVAGHSGAYAPIASLLTRAPSPSLPPNLPRTRAPSPNPDAIQIKRLVLLDATYGRSEIFARWIIENPGSQFWSAYRPGSPTESESLAIQARLRSAHPKVPYYDSSGTDGMPPSQETVENHRVGFLKSRSSHMKTVATYFAALLSPP